jgi:hypothetical protein
MIKYGPVRVVGAWRLFRELALLWVPEERLGPYPRRIHAWVLSAPATFTYVAIFSAFALVQETSPARIVELLTRLQSTSLRNLSMAPVTALVESAVWAADQGHGLVLYVTVFVTVVAWAERQYGTPRIILICAAGHVLGSGLTSQTDLWAIETGRAPASLALTIDVGVSYMMVAGCAGAVLLIRGWMLVVVGPALAIGILTAVVVSHPIWDLGHLLATVCGFCTAALTLAFSRLRTLQNRSKCLPNPEVLGTSDSLEQEAS